MKLTWVGLATVALAAAVLSFASLRSLAILCGTPAGLAWLLPLCLDAAAVVATGVWLSSSSPERARRYARLLALAMIALSVLGNGVDHPLTTYGVRPSWSLLVAVAAVPPAVLGAVAHLAALVIAPAVAGAEPGEQPGTHQAPPGDLATRASALVAAGDRDGVTIGRGRLAQELGITQSQARRLLNQIAAEHRPALHAVDSRANIDA